MSAEEDIKQSMSGYVMTYARGSILWHSRLQKVMALSTTDAECMAATEAGKEIIWMMEFIKELGFGKRNSDSSTTSVIHLAKNDAYHSRTTHIRPAELEGE